MAYLDEPRGAARSYGADPFDAFGRSIAQSLIAKVRTLPPPGRAEALQAILNAMEPGLAVRAGAEGQRLQVGSGLPARPALEAALTQTIAKGALREVAVIGRTKRPPSPRSLMGMGCACGLGAVETRDQRGTDPVVRTGTAPPKLTLVQVGAFTFSIGNTDPAKLGESHIAIHKDEIPVEWKTWLRTQAETITVHKEWWRDDPPTASAESLGLDKWLGIKGRSINKLLFTNVAPILKTTSADGREFGVFLRATKDVFEAHLRPVTRPTGVWEWLWAKLKYVASKIWDGVKWVAGKVKDATCKLANNPVTGIVAGAAGGPEAAAGVAIVAGLCASSAPPIDLAPPPIASQPSILPIALVGGGILLLLATRKG